MSLEVIKQFTVDADPDQLFTKLTTEFTEVSSWVTGITQSSPNPKYGPKVDGVAGGRVCQVDGFGTIDEELVQYEPARRQFAYTAEAEKIPGFVKELRNQWTISPAPGDRSAVTLRLTADVIGPLGAIMKPMMRRKFDKTLDAIGDDLRAYAERGTISAAKAKELASAR
ncbi:MAG: SRPBCC family protein [Actinomycetota bacterium]